MELGWRVTCTFISVKYSLQFLLMLHLASIVHFFLWQIEHNLFHIWLRTGRGIRIWKCFWCFSGSKETLRKQEKWVSHLFGWSWGRQCSPINLTNLANLIAWILPFWCLKMAKLMTENKVATDTEVIANL